MHWQSKLQAATASSTGEAEIIAAAEALRRMVLPLQDTLECMWGADQLLPPELYSDASVAEAALRSGWSRNLRYLRKHQRVSICAVRDLLVTSTTAHRHVESKANVADVFTKCLPADAHWRHAATLGLVRRGDLSG